MESKSLYIYQLEMAIGFTLRMYFCFDNPVFGKTQSDVPNGHLTGLKESELKIMAVDSWEKLGYPTKRGKDVFIIREIERLWIKRPVYTKPTLINVREG